MNLNLEGKVIMVAAGSKGLGFGVAQAVAQEGARVSLASRHPDHVAAAVTALRQQTGAEVEGFALDAADAGSIEAWTRQTVARFGPVYGLLVNAGGPPPGKFDQFDDEAWLSACNLTLMSAVRMIRAVLPSMRAAGEGSILTLTSTSIKEPIDALLLSNVFRSGVLSLVKSLATDLAAENIRINNLVPGRMDTDRVRTVDRLTAERRGMALADHVQAEATAIPLGRYGSREEFGAAAAFLLSAAASYITGATLMV
nr:SDR family oxidoreductase [Thiolinea sp.]